MTPENIAVASPENESAESEKSEQKIDKGTHVLNLEAFKEGRAAGFFFYDIEFKTPEAAVSHFTRNEKDGNDIVVGLINQAIAFNMRIKAKNKLPDEDTELARLKSVGEVLLINEADAEAYMPGERDVTSMSGLQKEIKALQKVRNEAIAKNDTVTATKLHDEIATLFKEMAKLAGVSLNG